MDDKFFINLDENFTNKEGKYLFEIQVNRDDKQMTTYPCSYIVKSTLMSKAEGEYNGQDE